MTAKAPKRQCILNSLIKIKANILQVCEWRMPMRDNTIGKLICYHKPGKDGGEQTGENTWPFLNLPGKEESTPIINHWTSNCHSKEAKAASQKHSHLSWGQAGSASGSRAELCSITALGGRHKHGRQRFHLSRCAYVRTLVIYLWPRELNTWR